MTFFIYLRYFMIGIISGTNRPHSNSLRLSKYYQTRLSEKSVESTLFSLEDLPENFITAEMYGKTNLAFAPYQERINSFDKFIFVIPEYNGSFPGILKTFVDACSYPSSFMHKKAALVGHSNGKYGNIRGVEHFSGVCHYLRIHVLPLRIHIPYIAHEFDENGRLFKADTLRFTDEQINEIIKF